MKPAAAATTLAFVLIGAFALGARAGGSAWIFDGEEYQPGDAAVSTTSVAWAHNSALGTPEDGPYLIHLSRAGATTETWPGIPDGSLLVGIVEIKLGPYRASDGQLYGPHTAIARLEIPDIPPGEYQIVACNDPCALAPGDIIGGWGINVVSGSGGPPGRGDCR